jgi:hypothetical protein
MTAFRPELSTPDDVRVAARWLAHVLVQSSTTALDVPAGEVSWSCWRTAEHVVDDLVAYALQVASGARLDYVPITGPRGESEVVRVAPASGPAGLAEALTASAELLATQVEAAPPERRAYHPFGLSDPAGFAAMGVVEILVHAYDVVAGLGLPQQAFPDGLAERALARLFPDAPGDTGESPDALLLWCTGRIALPGRERLTRWRWDSTVRATAGGA